MRIIKKKISYVILAGWGIVTICGCNLSGAKQYDQLEKKELDKGIRVDSLFLGISFGMTSKSFFGHCWELNKKGILFDGSNNTMALYKIDSALKFPATMTFYPDFFENKISHMRVNFQYNGWAPWNKAQMADSLITDVLGLYKKWYPDGNKFIAITDKDKRIIYVKVDGNRRIILGKFDDRVVKVDYSDLLMEEKIKKQNGIK